MRTLLVLAVALCLAACNSTGGKYKVPQPDPHSPSTSKVSMQGKDWDVRYSTRVGPITQEGAGWQFAFPGPGGHVHYVMHTARMHGSRGVVSDIEVTGNPGDWNRNPVKDPKNTCAAPASVRIMVQRRGDDLSGKNGKQYYRWWNVNEYALGVGKTRLNADLTRPQDWISVFGERGDASKASRKGFAEALKDIGSIGYTFGGGCFYGHGVALKSGSAVFHARTFNLN